MKLKKIAITNYRQFQNAVINFDDELTILAGANNSGKTSIIELFKRIFKDKNFSKEDISAEYYSKLQYDFISCINKIYNITDKETEFRENVKKEFSTENNNKWTAIKIKIEVQYDKNESISLFSDYLMELSDTCTSFFFLFNYEVNITELNKLLSLNATNLLDKKHEIQKLEAGRKTNKTRIKLTELQAEYEEFLKEIFDGALENRVYFADQNYENAGQISVREFQSLFNYNYLNATRLLNDEKTDNYFSISKELLSHFKKSNDWEEFKKQIIKDIKEGLKEQKLNEKVQKLIKIASCYYVTGNHEAWMGQRFSELERKLLDEKVEVLRDRVIQLEKDQQSIQIAGVDDPDFADRDRSIQSSVLLSKIKDLKLSDEYCVLLSHRPELFDTYVSEHVDMVLSGHAHGGQFRLPFVGGIIAPNQGLFPKYDAGIYTKEQTTMIVSRGIGNSVIPVRFNNRPEVVMIELNSQEH